MSIVYKCRHCGHQIGELDQRIVDTSWLGWDQLSIEDKKEMIHYKEDGNIQIDTICESCEETLEEHPQYHELDFFIQ
ncbi:MAG TPA: anti-sigma-F factor Fin family protein [Candidatus Avamphibacillus sp.]|nr:anti-sigma-F factor Fin family protein [Candidatus Avamphibacillus sp.]